MKPAPCYLVFGASGFIGSHIARELAAKNQNVIGTFASSPAKGLVPFDLRTDRLADLLTRCQVPAGTPLIAILCSALSRIDDCFREREESYRVNVEMTKKLIEDLGDFDAFVVFFSTTHVFDGQVGNYDEDSPTRPLSEYGRQKAAIEDYLRHSNQKSLVLRLDKIVGDEPAEPHLFSEWLQLAKSNQPIRCIEGQVFLPTSVSDIAQAVSIAIENNLTGLYHVANPESFRREELAKLFCSLAGIEAEVVSLPQEVFRFADDRPLKTNLDSSRFIKATGFKFTPMQEVIEEFLKEL